MRSNAPGILLYGVSSLQRGKHRTPDRIIRSCVDECTDYCCRLHLREFYCGHIPSEAGRRARHARPRRNTWYSLPHHTCVRVCGGHTPVGSLCIYAEGGGGVVHVGVLKASSPRNCTMTDYTVSSLSDFKIQSSLHDAVGFLSP